MQERSRSLALTLLLVSSAAASAVTLERTGAGFIFVTPTVGKASLRETPESGARSVGSPPTGARLVYRRLVEVDAKAAWYRDEPPGGVPGWIAARDTSLTRPSALPASKPMKLIEGRTAAVGSSSSTTAARGLDGRARILFTPWGLFWQNGPEPWSQKSPGPTTRERSLLTISRMLRGRP